MLTTSRFVKARVTNKRTMGRLPYTNSRGIFASKCTMVHTANRSPAMKINHHQYAQLLRQPRSSSMFHPFRSNKISQSQSVCQKQMKTYHVNKQIAPEWKTGTKLPNPLSEKWITIDPKDQKVPQLYRMMIQTIVPRPIAFVTTLSKDSKVHNAAPFSFFNGVCSNPPSLMFAITKKPDGDDKDTLRNILDTKQFVVNVVSEWMMAPMNHCAAPYDFGINELEKAGLSTIPSEQVQPHRIAESPFHMECELLNHVQVGEGIGSASVIIGKIVKYHGNASVMKIHDNKIDIDIAKLQPVARLGGIDYGLVSEVVSMERPTKVEK